MSSAQIPTITCHTAPAHTGAVAGIFAPHSAIGRASGLSMDTVLALAENTLSRLAVTPYTISATSVVSPHTCLRCLAIGRAADPVACRDVFAPHSAIGRTTGLSMDTVLAHAEYSVALYSAE